MQKILSSVFMRGMGSAFQFFSYMSVAALLSPAEYGVFQLNISLFVFLALLSKFGVENKLVAMIGGRHSGEENRLFEYEQVVFLSVLLLSMVVCVVVFSIDKTLGFERAFGRDRVRAEFAFVAIALALVSIISAVYRALGRPLLSSLFEFVLPYGCFLVLIFLLGGVKNSVSHYMALFSISIGVALVFGSLLLLRNKRDRISCFISKAKGALSGSLNLYVVDITNFLMTWLPFYVLGYYGNDRMLGLYALSFRVSQVFNIVIVGANASVAAKIARFTSSKSYQAASRESRNVSFFGALVLVPLFLLIVSLGGEAFDIYYPEYSIGLGVLFILAFAQLVNAYTASSQMIIIFSGNERFMKNVILFSMAVTAICSFIFIPLYGALGAAIACSSGLILQNLISVIFCYVRFGNLPIYLPKKFLLEKHNV